LNVNVKKRHRMCWLYLLYFVKSQTELKGFKTLLNFRYKQTTISKSYALLTLFQVEFKERKLKWVRNGLQILIFYLCVWYWIPWNCERARCNSPHASHGINRNSWNWCICHVAEHHQEHPQPWTSVFVSSDVVLWLLQRLWSWPARLGTRPVCSLNTIIIDYFWLLIC